LENTFCLRLILGQATGSARLYPYAILNTYVNVITRTETLMIRGFLLRHVIGDLIKIRLRLLRKFSTADLNQNLALLA
jgi:hypothetical protein